MKKTLLLKTVRNAVSNPPRRTSLYDRINPRLLPLISTRYV